MCCFARKTQKRYIETAYANRVQVEDVKWCVDLLTTEERSQIASKWDNIPIHSKEGVQELLKPLQGHVKSLARRHLSYVSRYDQSQDKEDIIADLNMFATYLIRRYEVNDLSREHLLRTVNQGLTHHVANLSSAYGRPKRRPIERIHKRASLKTVWWLRPTKLLVKKVVVDAKNAPRKITKTGDLQVLAVLKKSGKQRYVNMRDLFETKLDAVAMREKIESAEVSTQERDIPLIDLFPNDQDEYQLTNTSLDQPRGENGTKLLDLLPSQTQIKTDHEYGQEFVYQLSKHASDRLAKFAELVIGECPNGLFELWLEKRNRNINKLDPDQLGKLACRYLGVDLDDLKQDVLLSSSQLWSNSQLRLIDEVANPPEELILPLPS
jgi:hypothetical protein